MRAATKRKSSPLAADPALAQMLEDAGIKPSDAPALTDSDQASVSNLTTFIGLLVENSMRGAIAASRADAFNEGVRTCATIIARWSRPWDSVSVADEFERMLKNGEKLGSHVEMILERKR